MCNSFQVQDSGLARTRSFGVGLQYDFGLKGVLPGLLVQIRYGKYDMPDDLGQMDARRDRMESTFDVRYSFTKNSVFGLLNGISWTEYFF